MKKAIAGTCSLDEAFERFASVSEENREVLRKAEKAANRRRALSNKMKRMHRYVSIMHKLVLTKINGEPVFKLDRLSKEDREFIDKEWCNSI